MLDIEQELKALKLYGMAAVYAEIASQQGALACKTHRGYYASQARIT